MLQGCPLRRDTAVSMRDARVPPHAENRFIIRVDLWLTRVARGIEQGDTARFPQC
jgi:hypothetical protein